MNFVLINEEDRERNKSVNSQFVNLKFLFQDVSSRIAIRHMESCFNKFESQTSYGSLYKTNIEGYEMVCDFYNQQTGEGY